MLDKKNIKYYSCIKKLNIDNSKLQFPQIKKYDNENDNSIVYTELNGYKFMFMEDAGIGKDFINDINPKYSIISVGKNNRYGHPNKEVLNNLDGSKIYRTDQDSSIMLKIKNNKLKIESCSP